MSFAKRQRVQRQRDFEATTDVASPSVGKALPSATETRMSQGLGHSFADVRVHDGAEGDAVARAHDARALTVGSDLFFRAGEYAPESAAGAHVLAHELVHVVQQRPESGALSDGGEVEGVATMPNEAARGSDEQEGTIGRSEREAHAGADALSRGQQANIAPSTVAPGTVQRWPWDDSGGSGMLGSLANVVSDGASTLGGLGGPGGIGGALGGGGLRANTSELGSLPGRIFDTEREALSTIFPSPVDEAKRIGQTVQKARSGVESVIDPVISGLGRAAQWGGRELDGILGMGDGIGEGIAGGLGGAPILRLPDESDLE